MFYQLSFVATHQGIDEIPASEQLSLLYQSASGFERLGLTGLLLRHNNRLLYCMEGDEAAVSAQYDKIKVHPRVSGVAVLRQKHVETRNFHRWGFALDNDPRENASGTLADRVVELVHNAPPEIRQTFLAFAKLDTGTARK
ncbi:MAG: BLUF domain-containing protein [Sphingobium sp.]